MTGYDWTCQACGNKEPGTRFPVLEKLPDGEQRQIMVCETCEPQFERVMYLLRRFDGQLFPIEEGKAPLPQWRNDAPLHYTHNHIIYSMLEQTLAGLDEQERSIYLREHAVDSARLPLDDFPLVEDFEVSLETVVARHNMQKMRVPYFTARLYSPSLGSLGSFSGRIQSDYMCHSDFVIPHGDFTLPYYDLEQGIDLLIMEDDRFVYILSGDWKSHTSGQPGVWQRIENYYDSWVKIKRECYYSAWESALQQSRAFHGKEGSC